MIKQQVINHSKVIEYKEAEEQIAVWENETMSEKMAVMKTFTIKEVIFPEEKPAEVKPNWSDNSPKCVQTYQLS